MSTETACGSTRTCGGYFTDGPGDSEWRECATHAADRGRFLEIYTAQVRDLVGDRARVVAEEPSHGG